MSKLVPLVTAAALVLMACSSGASGEGASQASTPFELNSEPVATTDVTAVKSYRFGPDVIEVSAGTAVTWTNEDDFPHNVHFLTGSDDTLDLPIGASTEMTFDEAGDFYYECSIHPQQMRGKVIVTA